jgi:predicted transcriptional regulator of viral defense system
MANSKTIEQLESLKSMGVFKSTDVYKAGVSKSTLSRLVYSGELERLDHGIFMHPEADIDIADLDFIVACLKFGEGSFVGGLSALHRHRLIHDAPSQVWVITSPSIKSSNSLYRLVRSKHDPKVGVEYHERFRMSSVERTIVEALVYQKKMGARTAVAAIRNALSTNKTTEKAIYEVAKELGATSVFEKYWEVISLDEN